MASSTLTTRQWRTVWLAALCCAPSMGAFVQAVQTLGNHHAASVAVPLPRPEQTATATLIPAFGERRVAVYVQAPPEVCRAWAFTGLNLMATQQGKPVSVLWERPTGEFAPYAPDECEQTGERQIAFLNVEPGQPVRVSAQQKGEGAYNGQDAIMRLETGSYAPATGPFWLLTYLSALLAIGGLLLFAHKLKAL